MNADKSNPTLVAHQLRQRRLQFWWIEAEGAGAALEDHTSAGVDQINAVGPAGVGAFGGVAEFIKYSGKLDAQFAHAGFCHRGALGFILRAGQHDLIADVGFHLPDVAGMRLKDVDHEKCDAALVLVVETIKGGNLPPEGRSSIA